MTWNKKEPPHRSEWRSLKNNLQINAESGLEKR